MRIGGLLYILCLASKKLPKGSIQMAAKDVHAIPTDGLEVERRFFLQNAAWHELEFSRRLHYVPEKIYDVII